MHSVRRTHIFDVDRQADHLRSRQGRRLLCGYTWPNQFIRVSSSTASRHPSRPNQPSARPTTYHIQSLTTRFHRMGKVTGLYLDITYHTASYFETFIRAGTTAVHVGFISTFVYSCDTEKVLPGLVRAEPDFLGVFPFGFSLFLVCYIISSFLCFSYYLSSAAPPGGERQPCYAPRDQNPRLPGRHTRHGYTRLSRQVMPK